MNKIYFITCFLFLSSLTLFSQVSNGYVGIGPWYEIGSTPAKAALENTTDSYLNAKAVIGSTAPIGPATFSVYGNEVNSGNITISPSANSSATGIVLPRGAVSGAVLVSDAQGNARWEAGAVQYQTMVGGAGGSSLFKIENAASPGKRIDFFKNILIDTSKEIFGVNYGWNINTQQYVVPVTGVYRITMNIHSQPEKLDENPRVYIYKNSEPFLTPGIVSISETIADQTGYVMGLCRLNKDDVIELYVTLGGDGTTGGRLGNVRLYGAIGSTYILIESL